MRVLIFGAGPLGSLYAHLLHQAGVELTLLARGHRHEWLNENGLILVNEISGKESRSRVNLVNKLAPEDDYDLAIILVRKNKLPPIFNVLAACRGIGNILFMGNNALGFDQYLEQLSALGLLLGQPPWLLMADLDHFKSINDSLGPAARSSISIALELIDGSHIGDSGVVGGTIVEVDNR